MYEKIYSAYFNQSFVDYLTVSVTQAKLCRVKVSNTVLIVIGMKTVMAFLIRHTDHNINYLFTLYQPQRLGHWFGPLLFTGGTDSRLQEN
jgi:hypothetical protein